MHVHGMKKFTEHLIFCTEISQNRKCQCSLWNVKDSKASAQLLSRDFSKKTQVVLDRSSYSLGGQNGLKPLWSHPGERPWYPHLLLLLLLLLKGAQMVQGICTEHWSGDMQSIHNDASFNLPTFDQASKSFTPWRAGCVYYEQCMRWRPRNCCAFFFQH